MLKRGSRIVLLLALAILSIVLNGCPSPQPSNTYTLTIVSGVGGSTTPAGAQTVEPGVATAISALAGANYIWGNWTVTSGTASISDPSNSATTVTLSSGDATVQANFVHYP